MTAQERITEWAALADKVAESLPDDARMDAYYYGFDRTECGPVDAILSAVAIAGKGGHGTDQWGEDDEYGYYTDRPGLHPNRVTPTGEPPTAISLIQQTAQDSAERIAALATAVPAMATALAAVLERHKPVTVYGECDCTDEQKETGHVDVDEVGRTCNALYIICAECCRDDTYQTEDCADYHDHKPGEAICPTVTDIETALEVTE